MPSTLSPAAKSKVAVIAAVAMAGVTAWQVATRDGFTWWDLIPVVAAVAAVACTDHVENTLRRPAAKAVVHGALSAVAAVSAALAAVVGPEPSGVSAAKLGVALLGTLAVWYTPEMAAPAARIIEDEVAAPAAAAVSASMGPDLPGAAPVVPVVRDLSETQPFPPVTPEQPAPSAAPVTTIPTA